MLLYGRFCHPHIETFTSFQFTISLVFVLFFLVFFYFIFIFISPLSLLPAFVFHFMIFRSELAAHIQFQKESEMNGLVN